MHWLVGLRFQRRFSLIPGLRVNLSKSGASLSVGRRGAWLNFGGKREPNVTVGLPGSGLRYNAQLGNHAQRDPAAAVTPPEQPSRLALVVRVVIWLVVIALAVWSITRLSR